MLGNSSLRQAGFFIRRHRGDELGVEDFQLPPAKHRQRAVAGHAANGLVVVVVVAKLGHLGVLLVLAGSQLALQQALLPQPFAQGLHQRRVFGPALAEDVAHAVQHGGHGGEVFAALAFFGLHKRLGRLLRVERGVGKQLVGQRLDAEFARNLALGAALGLVGQVQVFQLLLGGRGLDGGAQLGRELALFFNAFEDGGAALVQLAQIAQARFQLAQLGIVQAVGGLFAVTGDERHGGAAVQQVDGRLHLTGLHANFTGNLFNNGKSHKLLYPVTHTVVVQIWKKTRSVPQAAARYSLHPVARCEIVWQPYAIQKS